ncbi:hypothetical protein GCM10025779_09910 [Arthrobacter cryoconiti]
MPALYDPAVAEASTSDAEADVGMTHAGRTAPSCRSTDAPFLVRVSSAAEHVIITVSGGV